MLGRPGPLERVFTTVLRALGVGRDNVSLTARRSGDCIRVEVVASGRRRTDLDGLQLGIIAALAWLGFPIEGEPLIVHTLRHLRGGGIRKIPGRLFARVPVTFGKPVPPSEVTAARLELLVRTLRGDWR